jgi:hypothetical protein
VVELDGEQEEGGTEVIGYKPVPRILWLPQIPRGLVCDRTRTSAERGRQLNALAMARVQLHLHPELSATASEPTVTKINLAVQLFLTHLWNFMKIQQKDIVSRWYQVTVGQAQSHTSVLILVCKSA